MDPKHDAAVPVANELRSCPFCNETEFDAAGLKWHLNCGHCSVFNETPSLSSRFAEGSVPPHSVLEKARQALDRAIWEDLNGRGSWDANPWVWVVSFRRVQP